MPHNPTQVITQWITPYVVGRFWDKTEVLGPDDCWPWLPVPDNHGYGKFVPWIGGKPRHLKAHRIAWEVQVGPIPLGADGLPLTVDHLCSNRICQNSSHMEPVPQPVNNSRGMLGPGGDRSRLASAAARTYLL